MFLFTNDLLDYVEKHEIKFIDWRFTDLRGRWHHATYSTHALDSGVFVSGIAFDGSSVPGWQPIEDSDMLLIPDISTAFVDPFSAQATLVVICNVICPSTQSDYSLDPRYTARKAQQYLVSTSIADKCFFGPEVEFFIFDRARFSIDPHNSYFKLKTQECESGSAGRMGVDHGYSVKMRDGYLCSSPLDSSHDIRSEILTTLGEVGVKPLLHYHEVAQSQCEVGFHHSELVLSAHNVQKCKYVLRNVACSYGKSVTFMPKPVLGDNGSGMHCHQSLWKEGANVFAGSHEDKRLSELCLHYIGGILKHGRALNAFSNSTTNSYKRLVRGYEAPVWLAFSHGNRSAAVRVPYANGEDPGSCRIEVRFPDPLANPYLCFASQLMAGLDGIRKKISPLEVVGKSLYDLCEHDVPELSPVCSSLEEALEALDKGRDFLLEGGVFTSEQIDAYIRIKEAEVDSLRTHPHPVEFCNYYSL